MIAAIVNKPAIKLIKRNVAGYKSTTQLLITAGHNLQRLSSESLSAALCGFSPVPVSLGKMNCIRLNQGGVQAANNALHIIAMNRFKLKQN